MSLYHSHGSVFHDVKNSAHRLSKEISTMVSSEDFELAMRNAEDNPDTKAFLTIEALKEISIDPLRGDTPADFFIQSEKTVCFNIGFDRWTNFIGLFELSVDSGRCRQVKEAIKQNLESTMFAAAKETRRLDREHLKLLEQHRYLAKAAHDEVMKRAPSSNNIQRYSKEWSENVELIKAEADTAYNQVMEPKKQQLSEEYKSVSRIACPGFQGSYTEAVSGFLYRHLPFVGISH